MWFGMPFCLGKIGTAASQAITLYYFRQSQPELASGRFNYCADTQRLRIYEARSFHRSRSFSFSVGGGGAFQTRRTNEWRTNVFLKLVSTVAIIRTHWDATGARQQSPLCLRRLHTCLQPERTSWKSSMDRTPIQEAEYQSWTNVFCLTPVCPFLLFLSLFPCSAKIEQL